MSHKNCTLCAVQRQSDGRGINVMTEHPCTAGFR